MISYVVGKLVEKNENKIVVECFGIGYEIFVSGNTSAMLGNVGEDVKIFTYLQVKEDGVALFGFASNEEKDLFNLLISISGIGAKVAIGVLSGMKISELIVAIGMEDIATISKIKGLGKKTAERIVLELKDKVNPLFYASSQSFEYQAENSNVNDAVELLVSLGMTKADALSTARANAKPDDSVEEIVTKSLRSLGR